MCRLPPNLSQNLCFVHCTTLVLLLLLLLWCWWSYSLPFSGKNKKVLYSRMLESKWMYKIITYKDPGRREGEQICSWLFQSCKTQEIRSGISCVKLIHSISQWEMTYKSIFIFINPISSHKKRLFYYKNSFVYFPQWTIN